MSITIVDQFAQPEPRDSAGQRPCPLGFYEGPIENDGKPRFDGTPTMWHVDLEYIVDATRIGTWADSVADARDLAHHKGAKGADGKLTQKAITYDAVKKRLPFWTPAGQFVPGHRHAPDYPQGADTAHGKSFPKCVDAEGLYPPVALSGLRFVV